MMKKILLIILFLTILVAAVNADYVIDQSNWVWSSEDLTGNFTTQGVCKKNNEFMLISGNAKILYRVEAGSISHPLIGRKTDMLLRHNGSKQDTPTHFSGIYANPLNSENLFHTAESWGVSSTSKHQVLYSLGLDWEHGLWEVDLKIKNFLNCPFADGSTEKEISGVCLDENNLTCEHPFIIAVNYTAGGYSPKKPSIYIYNKETKDVQILRIKDEYCHVQGVSYSAKYNLIFISDLINPFMYFSNKGRIVVYQIMCSGEEFSITELGIIKVEKLDTGGLTYREFEIEGIAYDDSCDELYVSVNEEAFGADCSIYKYDMTRFIEDHNLKPVPNHR